jgi:hypothetical protein
VPTISIVVCHSGGSVWTSDLKVPRNTGIACAHNMLMTTPVLLPIHMVLLKTLMSLMNMVEHPEQGLIQQNQRVFGSVGGVLVLIHPVV